MNPLDAYDDSVLPDLTKVRESIFRTKRMFLLIHPHLHHLHIPMPVLHLPVPENPFLIEKDNFTFVKVMSKESLEYMELQDVLLNHELDPLTMMNLCFTVFKDPVLTPDLLSQYPFRAFRPKGDGEEGYEFIPVPLIYQTKALRQLSLQEASKASHLVTPFQVQPSETTAR